MKTYRLKEGKIRPTKMSVPVRENVSFMCVRHSDASVAIELFDCCGVPDECVYAKSFDGNPILLFEDGDLQQIPGIGKIKIKGSFVSFTPEIR